MAESVLVEQIAGWLQEQINKAGARGAVCGLSGGIDSAVVAALGQKALGNEFLGLIMPCHSLSHDIKDAQRVADHLRLPHETVDLSPVYDLFKSILPPGPPMADANLKPRLRMVTLYYYAAQRQALVLGTSNKSEIAVGYFTKYGDGAADLLPLADLLKTEVQALAQALGLPDWLQQKPPTAGLWPEQTDEQEMGVTYKELDRFLNETAYHLPTTVSMVAQERILALMRQSAHKRQPPPVFRKDLASLG
ncbi:MAG: NAD(+) synthase [Deltaproteobacteria bacterium]|nr:NAD(+) synthase [Deltaproteobacteria bacterium]MBW2134441.1 NAD(+) synthase [Deltaproteobacteria bacterium]